MPIIMVYCSPFIFGMVSWRFHWSFCSLTSSDGETFISADDLRINLWNLEISNQSFNIVDVKPANMEDLTGKLFNSTIHGFIKNFSQLHSWVANCFSRSYFLFLSLFLLLGWQFFIINWIYIIKNYLMPCLIYMYILKKNLTYERYTPDSLRNYIQRIISKWKRFHLNYKN